jgi:uncharacterized protein (DUF697 family)
MDTDLEKALLERDALADEIIRKHIKYAVMGGSIPAPVIDLAAVSAVHLAMLKELAANYGATFDARSARAFMTSVSGALAGLTAARVAVSLMKILPGVGWTTGSLSQAVFTGATTFALGRLVRRLFRENRPLDELDVSTVTEELKSYFADGKTAAAATLKRLTSPFTRGDK